MVKRVYFLKKVNNVLDYLVMKIKAHTFALAIERDCFWLIGGALVQLVRIHACHAWGHGFESRTHRNNS